MPRLPAGGRLLHDSVDAGVTSVFPVALAQTGKVLHDRDDAGRLEADRERQAIQHGEGRLKPVEQARDLPAGRLALLLESDGDLQDALVVGDRDVVLVRFFGQRNMPGEGAVVEFRCGWRTTSKTTTT